MLYKFRIGNANLAYNFGDADKIQAYEEAVKTVGVLMQRVPQGAPLSEQIRFICGGVMKMFDDLFGTGTAKKIFGDSCDVIRSTEAIAQLVAAQRAADEAVADELIKLRDALAPTHTK